jgi:hypothetical protein
MAGNVVGKNGVKFFHNFGGKYLGNKAEKFWRRNVFFKLAGNIQQKTRDLFEMLSTVQHFK